MRAATLNGVRFVFEDLRTLLAKSSPLRSGDELAGLAADSHAERVAARYALADTPLTERAVTVDGVGRTVQVIADGRHLPLPAIAIPYFQWDNRGPGAMRVWIPGD